MFGDDSAGRSFNSEPTRNHKGVRSKFPVREPCGLESDLVRQWKVFKMFRPHISAWTGAGSVDPSKEVPSSVRCSMPVCLFVLVTDQQHEVTFISCTAGWLVDIYARAAVESQIVGSFGSIRFLEEPDLVSPLQRGFTGWLREMASNQSFKTSGLMLSDLWREVPET